MGTAVRRIAASLVLGLSVGLYLSSATDAAEMRRIGYITLDSESVNVPLAAAFRRGLREAGYIEAKNVTIYWRYAANDPSVLAGLVSELIGLKVEVIVADTTPAALAAKQATSTIAIVLPGISDPVAVGLVSSLARPGGNVTGLTLMSPGLAGKRLALLKEMAPRIHRVAMLLVPGNLASEVQLKEARAAAPTLGLEISPIFIRRPQDIDSALHPLRRRVDAIFVTDDALFVGFQNRIGVQAIRSQLPTICSLKVSEEDTCLMWYGPDLADEFVRAASYVAQILQGTKPADLPVQQPTKFTLSINAKTAKVLGIAIPDTLLVQAEEILR